MLTFVFNQEDLVDDFQESESSSILERPVGDNIFKKPFSINFFCFPPNFFFGFRGKKKLSLKNRRFRNPKKNSPPSLKNVRRNYFGQALSQEVWCTSKLTYFKLRFCSWNLPLWIWDIVSFVVGINGALGWRACSSGANLPRTPSCCESNLEMNPTLWPRNVHSITNLCCHWL